MRVGRLILVVATLVTILAFPLLFRDALQALRLPSAYAAPSFFDPGGRVYQNGNFVAAEDDDNDNNNDGSCCDNNDESDNEGEDNDNDAVECYRNLNSNEEVPCDFEDNDNAVAAPPAAPAPAGGPAPAGAATRCYAAGESGAVVLDAPLYDVTVTVVPGVGFPSSTRLALRALDRAAVPAPPTGTFLDAAVWQLDAHAGCDGAGIVMLPAPVNLAIRYDVAADKSKLQIVRLTGSQWVTVDTVPDPSPANPYISSTIQAAGTYAVVQRP